MVKAAACFMAAFGLALFGVYLIDRRVPSERNGLFAYYDWTQPGPDEYLSYDHRHFDHVILYHGLGPATEKAARADVFFLGHSRVGFGFRPETVREFSRRTGVNFYNLSFGYAEGMDFPLAVMEKHGLRPKVVVVNADGFFIEGMSDYARKAISMTVKEAKKEISDSRLSWRVKALVHRFLPQVNLGKIQDDLKIYRSTEDGAWIVKRVLSRIRPITNDNHGDPALDEATLRSARKFQEKMKEIGTALVLTVVPYPEANYDRAERLAKALGVPFISPRLEGLMAIDGSHLDDDSSRRFTEEFLDELIHLPALQRLASLQRDQRRVE